MQSIRTLVSGADGFIGSALVARLNALGHEVRALGRDVDLTDWECLKHLQGFQAVIHLAARSSVRESYQEPHRYFRDNFLATLNMLELARVGGARFVLAGSYVYGVPRYLPIDESHPTSAVNPYAASKLMAEELCDHYHKNFGVPTAVLRMFNVYGPGQPGDSLIPTILAGLAAGRVSLGERGPRRDFVYIDDAVEAFVKVLERNGAPFDVFNVGSGRSASVEEVVEIVRRQSGVPLRVNYDKPPRPAEIPDVRADCRKAFRLLDWAPRVHLETGIGRMLSMRSD